MDTGSGMGAGRVTNTVAELMATTPELVKSIAGVDLGALAQRLTAAPAPASARPAGDGARQSPALIEPADDGATTA